VRLSFRVKHNCFFYPHIEFFRRPGRHNVQVRDMDAAYRPFSSCPIITVGLFIRPDSSNIIYAFDIK
jgi:hypothetical protein